MEVAHADVILTDRGTLNTILGPAATTEDFEKYQVGNVSVSAFIAGGGTVLDKDSIFGGNLAGQGTRVRGPGLIEPGISFDWGNSNLQWNKSGGTLNSRHIVSFGTNSVSIAFDDATRAFGLDLYAPYSGPGAPAGTIDYLFQVFGPDHLTLLTTFTASAVFSQPQPVFRGFEAAGGIGRVVLATTNVTSPYNRSPQFDNVTFGSASVPEPSAFAVLAFGMAVGGWSLRRKKSPRFGGRVCSELPTASGD